MNLKQEKKQFLSKTKVFIVHWNSAIECLNTVEQFKTTCLPLDIVILDNGSKKEQLELLESRRDGFEIIRLQENLGWGRALNKGLSEWLEEGGAPYCIICAQDPIFYGENCIQNLFEVMDKKPDVGMAAPVYKDKNYIVTYEPVWGIKTKSIEPRMNGEVEISQIIHQTLTIFRRDCIKDIGLYDERFFAYGEEYDLPLRAFNKEWNPVLVWDSKIENPGCASPCPAVAFLLSRNSLLLAEKHGGKISAFVRAILLLVNSLQLLIRGRKPVSQLARIWGVKEFFARNFGKPSERIWKLKEK